MQCNIAGEIRVDNRYLENEEKYTRLREARSVSKHEA